MLTMVGDGNENTHIDIFFDNLWTFWKKHSLNAQFLSFSPSRPTDDFYGLVYFQLVMFTGMLVLPAQGHKYLFLHIFNEFQSVEIN